jgi:hypothetical protein
MTARDRLDMRGAAMTDTATDSGYPGYGAPSSGHHRYSSGYGGTSAAADRVTRSLWTIVAVLGAATFAVKVASPVVSDFPIRLSVFGAIVAAVGLLRGQGGRGWIVLAATLTGFLDGAAGWARSGETGWAPTVVMVLTALQALVAAGALLHETRRLRSADSTSARDYLAYVQVAAAYQAYASYGLQAPATDVPAEAQATARGEGSASASTSTARVYTEQESLAALQARYARQEVGPARQPHGSSGATPSGPMVDPGLPGVDRGVPSPPSYRPQRDSPGHASSS